MSSVIKKLNTNCISSKVLLNEKYMVRKRKECNKCLVEIWNKIKKPIIKHVYESNTMIKGTRTLITGRSKWEKPS